jgi:hypothetical protein
MIKKGDQMTGEYYALFFSNFAREINSCTEYCPSAVRVPV